MRFKKFNDIENIRHAKVKETPLKNFTGKIDEVHCSKPSSNTSAATKREMLKCKVCLNKETKQ